MFIKDHFPTAINALLNTEVPFTYLPSYLGCTLKLSCKKWYCGRKAGPELNRNLVAALPFAVHNIINHITILISCKSNVALV